MALKIFAICIITYYEPVCNIGEKSGRWKWVKNRMQIYHRNVTKKMGSETNENLKIYIEINDVKMYFFYKFLNYL